MIKINGVTLPSLSDYLVGIHDISKAERNANGTMIIERITTKRKIELGWKHLDKQQLSNLLSLVSNVFFQVEYPDPQDGNIRTGIFYCGDRPIGAFDYSNGEVKWNDIKFSIIER